MDRMDLSRAGWVLLVVVMGCKETPQQPAPSRFAAVKSTPAATAQSAFCEKSFPATGPGSKKLLRPPLREIPGVATTAATPGQWTWLNLWATWCGPCMEEMALLGRWKTALAQDGVQVEMELLSVDEAEEDLTRALAKRSFPGRVEWLKGPQELQGFMETLGVPKESPIPVHALVDPAGMVRCVRVGSVHDQDFGSVKAVLAGR